MNIEVMESYLGGYLAKSSSSTRKLLQVSNQVNYWHKLTLYQVHTDSCTNKLQEIFPRGVKATQ